MEGDEEGVKERGDGGGERGIHTGGGVKEWEESGCDGGC